MRPILIGGLCLVLGAQGVPGKKDPLAAALGGGSHKGTASELGSAGIDAAFKGAQAESAQGIAYEVVSLLGSLTLDAERTLVELDEARADEARRWDLLQQRRSAMDEYMAEYCQGLFCSGCQKSKSEIERKGEQFPHPGRHIVRPTQAEIAAKERELQAGVDQLSAAWGRARERVQKLKAKLDDLLDQIPQGHALWCTASTYASNLAARRRAQTAYDLRRELQTAERRVDEATRAWTATHAGPAEKQAREAKVAAQAQVDKRRERLKLEDRRASEEEARQAQVRKDQSTRIAEYFDRPHLRRNLALSPAYTAMNRMSGPEVLGGRFLMGRLPSQSPDGAPLDSVQAFLAEFRACDPGMIRLGS